MPPPTTTRAIVTRCVQRCARADASSHARGQAQRRCVEQLLRQGGAPSVSSETAAVARRMGEWLAER